MSLQNSNFNTKKIQTKSIVKKEKHTEDKPSLDSLRSKANRKINKMKTIFGEIDKQSLPANTPENMRQMIAKLIDMMWKARIAVELINEPQIKEILNNNNPNEKTNTVL